MAKSGPRDTPIGGKRSPTLSTWNVFYKEMWGTATQADVYFSLGFWHSFLSLSPNSMYVALLMVLVNVCFMWLAALKVIERGMNE